MNIQPSINALATALAVIQCVPEKSLRLEMTLFLLNVRYCASGNLN